jgi:hypothetical protein
MTETSKLWLMLIHRLPPKPAYLRVKVSRRLQQVGAIALKNTVYILPGTDEAREDFQWISEEIRNGGGDALIGELRLLDGVTAHEVDELVRAARLAKDSGKPVRLRLGRDQPQEGPPEWTVEKLRDLTWVTRGGVGVDRIASAWLVRRFIDPEAVFRFVDAKTCAAAKGQIRFDMFDGELTHDGDRCTFEVIRQRLGLDVPGLRAVAQVVHDIDLKDGRYGRPETNGVATLIAGISGANVSDEERLERGFVLFDGLLTAAAENEPKPRASRRKTTIARKKPRAQGGRK